jgi:hypothetical protein
VARVPYIAQVPAAEPWNAWNLAGAALLVVLAGVVVYLVVSRRG